MEPQLRAARQARKGIEQVRKRLAFPAPEILTACTEPLTQAIDCMTLLQQSLSGQSTLDPGGQQTLRLELNSLRRELKTVNALLTSAGEFYQGYGRLLGNEPEGPEIGYGAVRRAAVPDAGARFTIHG